MRAGRDFAVVWVGVVAVLIGLLLLLTPTGVHHDGVCGSVLAPRHPGLRADDLLEEQVTADADCPTERRFRAVTSAVTVGGGLAVIGVGWARATAARKQEPQA
jgi:hypothetical protein